MVLIVIGVVFEKTVCGTLADGFCAKRFGLREKIKSEI